MPRNMIMRLSLCFIVPVIPADQMLSVECDDTLGESRPASDAFCIDRACLPSQIALYRVSAGGSDGGQYEEVEHGGRGGSTRRESSCSALRKDTFHNEYILLLIPNLNGSIDLIEPPLHHGP